MRSRFNNRPAPDNGGSVFRDDELLSEAEPGASERRAYQMLSEAFKELVRSERLSAYSEVHLQEQAPIPIEKHIEWIESVKKRFPGIRNGSWCYCGYGVIHLECQIQEAIREDAERWEALHLPLKTEH